MASLPRCKFWDKCYRKNPDHLKQFLHPPKTNATGNGTSATNKTQNLIDLDKDDSKSDAVGDASQQPSTNIDAPSANDDPAMTPESRTNPDRKRRASISESESEDDEKDKKKMKFDTAKEEEANEKTIDDGKAEGEKEKPSKKTNERDDSDDDDDDDDFLTIVSTGKTDEAIEDKTNKGAKDNDSESLSSLTTEQFLKVGKEYDLERQKKIENCLSFHPNRIDFNSPSRLLLIGQVLHGISD